MENLIVKELFHSKCKKDYKSRHYFEKLGVIHNGEDVLLILKCSQCGECICEPLVFLEVGEDMFRMDEKIEAQRQVINHYIKQYKDLSKLTKKRFYSVLQQVYYLGELNTKQLKKVRKTKKDGRKR